MFLIIPFFSSFNLNHIKSPYVSPILKPYVIEYLNDMNTRGINTHNYYTLDSIKVAAKGEVICGDSSAVGCYEAGVEKVSIRMPLGEDIKDTDEYYRLTIYHELGHAILKLKHATYDFAIMNPYKFLNLWTYRECWPHLVNDYSRYYRIIESINKKSN